MKFKKGDRVRFLNDVGGGSVIRYGEQGQVHVLTEDGFEIPVSEKELVFAGGFAVNREQDEPRPIKPEPVKPEQRKPEQKEKAVVVELPANLPADTPVHFLLGIVPENPGPVFASNLECYLINDSAYCLYYQLGEKSSGVLRYVSSGMIEADTKCYVASFDHTTLSKMSDMHVQALFLSRGRYMKKEPVDKLIRLNLVNFSKESYFRENDYFEQKAVLFNLSGDELPEVTDEIVVPDEVKALKNEADSTREGRQKKKEESPDTLEVDLHLDEITMKSTQLTPAAILSLQMSRFHGAIEEAIGKNMRRLVVIHGIGQGTLKMQIRKELQEKYPNYIYQDASFREYGFGATMVHLVHE
ncbi:MAG: DUF2027 domain-containing protein [Bacteroidales bacterium]